MLTFVTVHPLLLAAGELIRGVGELIGKPHALQGRQRAFPADRAGQAAVDHGHLHVLQHVQLGQKVILLKYEAQHLVADLRQLVVVQFADVDAV